MYDRETQNSYVTMVKDAVGLDFHFNISHDNESRFEEEDPNPNITNFYFLLNDADDRYD